MAGPTKGLVTGGGRGVRLHAPLGAGVDMFGNVYVADQAPEAEVIRLDSAGAPVWKLAGSPASAMSRARSIRRPTVAISTP